MSWSSLPELQEETLQLYHSMISQYLLGLLYKFLQSYTYYYQDKTRRIWRTHYTWWIWSSKESVRLGSKEWSMHRQCRSGKHNKEVSQSKETNRVSCPSPCHLNAFHLVGLYIQFQSDLYRTSISRQVHTRSSTHCWSNWSGKWQMAICRNSWSHGEMRSKACSYWSHYILSKYVV